MHPACPNKKQNHLPKQLAPTDAILGPENLFKTGFGQKGLLVAFPVAVSHKVSIETKTLRLFNPDAKKYQNEPEHGTKNQTAKLQNQQQRRTRATKNYNCIYFRQRHLDLNRGGLHMRNLISMGQSWSTLRRRYLKPPSKVP